METPEEEHKRVTALKALVDDTANKITSGELDMDAVNKLVEATRVEAEKLIPDDMDKYDMIYSARFKRLIEQYISASGE